MSTRVTGFLGFSFVVLLLVSAGMASVPTGSDVVSSVRQFYVDNTAVVVVAQLIGLAAAAAFAAFALRLDAPDERRSRLLRISGVAVAAAAVATAVPPLALCAVADDAPDSSVHALAVASDVTDVVLFACIAAFAACVAWTRRSWLRAVAVVTAILAFGRALLWSSKSDPLEAIAPLAFVVLVIVLSVVIMRSGRKGAVR